MLLHAYATLLTVSHDLRDRLRDDDGQTAAEYVGILFVLVAVIGAVLAAAPGIGGEIAGFISSAIAQMTGGG